MRNTTQKIDILVEKNSNSIQSGRSIGQIRQNNLKSTKRVGGQADSPQHQFAQNLNGAPCQTEKKKYINLYTMKI